MFKSLTFLIILIFFFSQSQAFQLHTSDTVIGNILLEPYTALLTSILLILLTLI